MIYVLKHYFSCCVVHELQKAKNRSRRRAPIHYGCAMSVGRAWMVAVETEVHGLQRYLESKTYRTHGWFGQEGKGKLEEASSTSARRSEWLEVESAGKELGG